MIDLHCDTLSRIWKEKENLWQNQGQWDAQRARFVGMSLQVCALFTEPQDPTEDWKKICQQISYFKQQFDQEKIQQKTLHVRSRQDLENCFEQQKMGILLHLEGADALGKNLGLLENLYEWGVRSLSLTWNHRNAFADGALVYDDTGLSDIGRQLIHDMNERNILLDVAHASEKTFFQALETTQRPAYVSHTNVAHLCKHPRNLKDEQIKAIAQQGGIIGLTYYREFLAQEGASVQHLLDHMVYLAELVGCETLALGSDFDGAQDMVFSDVMETLALKEQMQKRGFYPEEIEQILEQNARRFFQKNL